MECKLCHKTGQTFRTISSNYYSHLDKTCNRCRYDMRKAAKTRREMKSVMRATFQLRWQEAIADGLIFKGIT